MSIFSDPYFLGRAAYLAILFAISFLRQGKNKKKGFFESRFSLLLLLPCIGIAYYLISSAQERPSGLFELAWAVVATVIWMGMVALIGSVALYALIMGISILFTPKWMKANEKEAIEAISRVTSHSKLQKASEHAPSFRVRAMALEKLGRKEEACAEMALHEKDINAGRTYLDQIREEALLARVVLEAQSERVSSYALVLIQDENTLRTLQGKLSRATPLCFELNRRLRDAESCSSILHVMLSDKREAEAAACLASVYDQDFLRQLFLNQGTADVSRWIAEQYHGKRILEKVPEAALADLCCPDGTFHLYQEVVENLDMGLGDDDDMKAHRYFTAHYRVCQNCGKRVHISKK